MVDNGFNTKRIAKNTIVLYLRSIIIMMIALYTSRIVLKGLGVEDYGLYNVVGGVVSLFAFLRTSLAKSTQRFLNIEMGKPNGRVAEIFKVAMTLHICIAVIIFILAETVGLWFLNYYINIPQGREFAANIIYQSTIVSLLESVLVVPYTASIIANEDMRFFAVVSIIESVLKLVVAILITITSFDHLVVYGVLLSIVSIIDILLYIVYCRYKFEEAKFGLSFDRYLLRQITGYTSWNILGYSSVVAAKQGNNILLNIYHSVVANAAMGVANQVNSAFTTFTGNFQTAFNPQITKSYAAGDYSYLKTLVFASSKISFFLITIMSLPIIFNMESVLEIWLTEVPQYASVFCVLVLCDKILDVLSTPLNYLILSTSNIRNYQILSSCIYFSDPIIVLLFFIAGSDAYYALIVKIFIMILILFLRIHYSNKVIDSINIVSYSKQVLIPITLSLILTLVVGWIMFHFSTTLVMHLLSTIILFFCSVGCAYLIGLSADERLQVQNMVRKKLKNI